MIFFVFTYGKLEGTVPPPTKMLGGTCPPRPPLLRSLWLRKHAGVDFNTEYIPGYGLPFFKRHTYNSQTHNSPTGHLADGTTRRRDISPTDN